MSSADPILLAGSAHPALAAELAAELGIRAADRVVQRFPDGELGIELREPVSGRTVVIVQPTAPPVADNLVELLGLLDAARRAGAARTIAVVPYFGYARGDNRHGRREPVLARVAADAIQVAGARHLVAVHLHSPAVEGFFAIPADDVDPVPLLCAALRPLPEDAVVVSPDLGGARMATRVGAALGRSVAVLIKRRLSGEKVEMLHVAGEVAGRRCVIVDDMISTGKTVVEAMRALEAAGAQPAFVVAATHGVFSDGAGAALRDPRIREIVVTDTIAAVPEAWPPVRVVTIVPALAAAVRAALGAPGA